jgi:Lon protease-like protein
MPKELPARPNIEHLKSQAKDLLDAFRRGDVDALQRFHDGLPSAHGLDEGTLRAASFALHDAQSVIAREYGFGSFAQLCAHVESLALRSLMAAHPSAPLPHQVIEAMSSSAASKPRPKPISESTTLPVIPLRNALLTAGALAPINIGRPSSIAAAAAARADGSVLVAIAQKDPANENPAVDDLYRVGCTAQIVSTVEGGPYGTFLVLRGLQWVTLDRVERSEPYTVGSVSPFHVGVDDSPDVRRLEGELRGKLNELVVTLPGGEHLRAMIDKMNALELADAAVANLPCAIADKASYAAEPTLIGRLERALALVRG